MATDAREDPEHTAHRSARLADSLELDLELRARRRQAGGGLAEQRPGCARTIEVLLDLRARVRDAGRLGVDRGAGALDLPPHHEAPDHGVRDPGHDAHEKDCERDPEQHGGATIVTATRGGAVR